MPEVNLHVHMFPKLLACVAASVDPVHFSTSTWGDPSNLCQNKFAEVVVAVTALKFDGTLRCFRTVKAF